MIHDFKWKVRCIWSSSTRPWQLDITKRWLSCRRMCTAHAGDCRQHMYIIALQDHVNTVDGQVEDVLVLVQLGKNKSG